MLGDDGIEKNDKGEIKSVMLHVGDTMERYEFKLPKSPDNWVDPAPNTAKGGPTFDKLDNPGACIRFSYRPIFTSGAQGGQYKAHCTPSGYQPVQPNEVDNTILTHGG